MQSLGGVHANGNDNYPWLEYYYLPNPPTGSQTVSVTIAKSGITYHRLGCASLSYMNCRGVTGLLAESGTASGTSLSQTVTSRTAEMVLQSFLTYSAFQSGSISAYNQSLRLSLAAGGGGEDEAVVVGDAMGASSVSFTATAVTSNKPYAQLAVRLQPVFAPSLIENAPTSGQAIPHGVSGCYVTLIGGGGGGGTGYGQAFTACGGGGGGGGGAVVQRSFISVTNLGATYSVTVGAGGGSATAGGDTTFTSGSVTVTAGGGGNGANGISGNGNAAAGGIGGVASVSGVSGITTVNGTAGGIGGDPGGTAPPGTRAGGTAGDNTSGGAPGGGGGGSRTGAGGTARSGAGGNSLYANGGAAQLSADDDGLTGGNAGAGQPGGGGSGGASGNSGSGGVGGTGGTYGAGAGGGGSGNAVSQGGTGAPGYALIEWV